MTNSLCVICNSKPKKEVGFAIVEQVLVCCGDCIPTYEKQVKEREERCVRIY